MTPGSNTWSRDSALKISRTLCSSTLLCTLPDNPSYITCSLSLGERNENSKRKFTELLNCGGKEDGKIFHDQYSSIRTIISDPEGGSGSTTKVVAREMLRFERTATVKFVRTGNVAQVNIQFAATFAEDMWICFKPFLIPRG